jgi:hypothetical protein
MRDGLPFTFDDELPEGTRVTPVRFVSSDGMESSGWFYEPPVRARTALLFVHPRVEFGRHYLIPRLVASGFAVLGHNGRALNNDSVLVYERLLLDVAQAMRWLRARADAVILVGNSGGGTLATLYQTQATRPPGERLVDAAGGGKLDLRGELPAADGVVILAAHPGEGRFLLQTIDPSVTDEGDPLSCDPTLDMFNPANGYDLATRTARYDPAWLARYREAQRARVTRLDEAARAQILVERQARAALVPGLPPYDLLQLSRRAIPHRLMLIHRTVANPAYLDLSIDPNDREVGSIFGILAGRPEFGNYFEINVARVLSPRSWLSTWSGFSSRADFLALAPSLRVPVLFMPAAGDSDILPADADAMWGAIGAADRTRHDLVCADHYLRPTARRTGGHPRDEVREVLASWLGGRFQATI